MSKNNKKTAKHVEKLVNKQSSLFCENCQAQNASLIYINNSEDKYILCPRCLKILEELEQEYKEICGL